MVYNFVLRSYITFNTFESDIQFYISVTLHAFGFVYLYTACGLKWSFLYSMRVIFCIFSCFIYIFVLVICILGDFVNCWLCLIACIFVYAAKTLPRAYQNFISNVCAYIVSLSTPSASDVLMCFTIQIVSCLWTGVPKCLN